MLVKEYLEKILPFVIVDKNGVSYTIELLTPMFAMPVSKLYKDAHQRGEHLATNYPNKEIYDANWIKSKIDDTSFTWMIVRNGENVIGSEILSETSGKIISDETLIAPEHRGRGLLPSLFDFVFNKVQNKFKDMIVGGEIVFWPFTSSMRRIVQGKYNWKSLGILPNKYLGKDGTRKSLLPAYHYPKSPHMKACIIKPVVPLYKIIQEQLMLDEPEVVDTELKPIKRNFAEYREVYVDAKDHEEQAASYKNGFRPVAMVPEKNQIIMARFPLDNLLSTSKTGNRAYDFVFKEHNENNKRLARYIYAMAD